MSIEETNDKQAINLSKLRASIKIQQDSRQKVEEERRASIPVKKLELLEVPAITIESATEFNLERHTQLCECVNALYHNYLFAKESWKENEDNFEEAMKELASTYEELINEGLKIRWS